GSCRARIPRGRLHRDHDELRADTAVAGAAIAWTRSSRERPATRPGSSSLSGTFLRDGPSRGPQGTFLSGGSAYVGGNLPTRQAPSARRAPSRASTFPLGADPPA